MRAHQQIGVAESRLEILGIGAGIEKPNERDGIPARALEGLLHEEPDGVRTVRRFREQAERLGMLGDRLRWSGSQDAGFRFANHAGRRQNRPITAGLTRPRPPNLVNRCGYADPPNIL